MNENRPKLDIPLSGTERLAQALIIAGVVAMLVLLARYWPVLPERIPSHFGVGGQVDGWGNKGTFLVLPVIGSISAITMLVLSRFPQIYNYNLFELTEQNIRAQYQLARSMILWLGVEVAGVIAYSEYAIAQVGIGATHGVGAGFLPVFLAVLFGSTAIHVYKMYKAR